MNGVTQKCLHTLIAALLLAGCTGKSVDVIQADQFKNMADRMSQELIARDIIDTSRNYTPPFLGSPAGNYGAALFTRLSPAFLFEDQVNAFPARSFATGIQPGDRVQRRENGFTIHSLRAKTIVNMIAVADWDGDGNQDWLVSCLVEPHRGGRSREYYVIIFNPSAEGPLRGATAAIYECFGLACKLYMRESKIPEAPAPGDAPTSAVTETVPGLKAVTLPPDAAAPKESGLIERNLD